MEWIDEGVILGVRKHGEGSVILEAMTRGHGRHLGLVRGGRSVRQQSLLQPGNSVALTWRARLEEHLGTYAVEATHLRAPRFLESAMALHGLGAVAALVRLLPERDPHPALYEALGVLLDHLDEPEVAPALYVRFELEMLSELGFGLDLSCCAATGSTQNLAYVSPKSGRAVCAEAGEPYRNRLLPLPAFLRGAPGDPAPADIRNAFDLTGFFLRRDVFEPRGHDMPHARENFFAAL